MLYDSKTSEGRAKAKAFKKLGLGEYDSLSKKVPLDRALHMKVNPNLSKSEYEGLRKDLMAFCELPSYK